MKRKFNNINSDAPPHSSPLKAQNSASKVVKKSKIVKNRSQAIATKPKSLPTRAKNNKHEEGCEVKRSAMELKIEKTEVEDSADGDTESSFVDYCDLDSE